MSNLISIVICTYNPEEYIFVKCLEAIKIACNNFINYQILIIDNNSTNNFRESIYFINFCQIMNAQIFIETKQGLTYARLRGISESSGDIIVFIDDDNIISPNFLNAGFQIALNYENIGSWSGRVVLDFEITPEPWTEKYHGLLVKREINNDYWSNLPHIDDSMPHGAGLFVRRNVADYYFLLHQTGKRNILLDRCGDNLFSGGDNDLAACACDIGMGMGVFHSIALMHYIPAFRLEKKYLLKLAKGIAASSIVFHSFRGEIKITNNYKNKIANLLRWLLKSPIEKDFFIAVQQGQKEGLNLIKSKY
jgi:glycosyltransferase involved in cell wall biosynthesis